MTIKEIFEKAENGTLTYEQFIELAKEAKFADLTTGEYVSKHKYDEDIKAKDTEISGLNDTIKTRDNDLKDVKKKLKDAGTDANKLSEIETNLSNLQEKYNTDTKELQDKLNRQAYEFAVRTFAGTKKFTSNAAKRDFERSMIAENLKLDKSGQTIIGADDFVKIYSEANTDAFVVESPKPTEPEPPKPTFVNTTPGSNDSSNSNNESNAFLNAFHFTGVRPMNKE